MKTQNFCYFPFLELYDLNRIMNDKDAFIFYRLHMSTATACAVQLGVCVCDRYTFKFTVFLGRIRRQKNRFSKLQFNGLHTFSFPM